MGDTVMAGYTAPLRDMTFVLRDLVGLDGVAALPGYGEVTPDLVSSVLEQAARFAGEVLAPLNRTGDRQPSRIENGVVRTPEGFRGAYDRFVAAGWNGVPFDPTYGGQGLPWLVAAALQEMWSASNLAFSLCPLLTQGAVELLHSHGSAEQKQTYLRPMIAGRWPGTMNLTEPQAGSDLGMVRTKAVRDGDTYRVSGQKIFITYGDHDLTENIVHLVLARTPDAPAGTKGLSLFIVPKRLIGPDGQLGTRNDVRCVSLEHKLGIHGSPTAVMAYGDQGGAVGYLVGEECQGIEYTFTMMNNARLAVGIQGLAVAERAYQQACAYAKSRIQGRVAGGDGGPAPIIRHPDVRRMLMTMRASVEAMRALIYFTAGALDRAKRHPEAGERARSQALVDLLIPVVKAWCTEQGCTIASLNIQVHGGLGFIEETGAAQLFRDARIAPIYEGTNGIQANDLVARKLMRDRGVTARVFFTGLRQTVRDLATMADDDNVAIGRALAAGFDTLARATDWLVGTYPLDPARALAGATPYLHLLGTVAGGWLLAESALAAMRGLREGNGDDPFLRAKPSVARFYAENLLPQANALAAAVMEGGGSTLALAEEQF